MRQSVDQLIQRHKTEPEGNTHGDVRQPDSNQDTDAAGRRSDLRGRTTEQEQTSVSPWIWRTPFVQKRSVKDLESSIVDIKRSGHVHAG